MQQRQNKRFRDAVEFEQKYTHAYNQKNEDQGRKNPKQQQLLKTSSYNAPWSPRYHQDTGFHEGHRVKPR